MQARHLNRKQYFNELALTSQRYFMPYVRRWNNGSRILEIGCGDGGNLLPFAQAGCYTLGVDMAEERIADARRFFSERRAKGDFIASDVFLLKGLRGKFDVILCHDVIEHISDKERFLSLLPQFLAQGGGDFHVVSRVEDAFWRSSADMPQPHGQPLALHPSAAHGALPPDS